MNMTCTFKDLRIYEHDMYLKGFKDYEDDVYF